MRVRGCARPGPPPPTPAARGLRPPHTGVWSRSRRRVAAPGTWRPTPLNPGPECTDSPLSALLPSPPPCRREAPPSLPSRERGRAGRAGRNSGGGGRGSRACSEGPAEARGREGGEGSAALPLPPPLPPFAGQRWRRSGEPGYSSAPPPSGSAACCCSGARCPPRPPGAVPRRSPQVSGGAGPGGAGWGRGRGTRTRTGGCGVFV